VPVIHVFHVDAAGDSVEGIVRTALYRHVPLDAAATTSGFSGGTGLQIDWEGAESGKDRDGVRPSGPLPIILAGAFGPGNVAGVMHDVWPWDVDACGTQEGQVRISTK